MNDLSARPLRIIPAESGGVPPAPRPAAQDGVGFDYAGLAEKARVARETRAAARRRRESGAGRGPEHERDAGGTRAGAAPAPGMAAARGEQAGIEADARGGAARDRSPASGATQADVDAGSDDILGLEVAQAAWPVVHEVSRVADAFAVMLVSLAREVAAFCAVPAISHAGQWEARVPLDERTFPHTTLHLALSPFQLSLRFDCRDPGTRQLLCGHEASLKRELGELMKAWGEPRAIEISAW